MAIEAVVHAKDFIRHDSEMVLLIVIQGDNYGTILGQQFFEELEAGPHHAEPFVVALEVFALDGVALLFQPLAHERAVDLVVVAPALGAGVVGRVDVDAVHPPRVAREQRLEGFEIVAVQDEVAIEIGRAAGRPAFLRRHQQLAIRHAEMVRVDEALAFEIKRGHGGSGGLEWKEMGSSQRHGAHGRLW